MLPKDKARGNEYKLKHRRFTLNIRKGVRMAEHCNRFSREVVESLSLKILKPHLNSPDKPGASGPA